MGRRNVGGRTLRVLEKLRANTREVHGFGRRGKVLDLYAGIRAPDLVLSGTSPLCSMRESPRDREARHGRAFWPKPPYRRRDPERQARITALTREIVLLQRRREHWLAQNGKRTRSPYGIRGDFRVQARAELPVHGWACWTWLGATHKRKGRTRVPTPSLRRVFEMIMGPVERGTHFHHECRNPMCVNPTHMAILTPEQHLAVHAEELEVGRYLVRAAGAEKKAGTSGHMRYKAAVR